MHLPPVIPAVDIAHIDAKLVAVQALQLLQHELTEMAAFTAVYRQLDQGYCRSSLAKGSPSVLCSDLAIISTVGAGTSPTAVTR